jgi:hypothetical protein
MPKQLLSDEGSYFMTRRTNYFGLWERIVQALNSGFQEYNLQHFDMCYLNNAMEDFVALEQKNASLSEGINIAHNIGRMALEPKTKMIERLEQERDKLKAELERFKIRICELHQEKDAFRSQLQTAREALSRIADHWTDADEAKAMQTLAADALAAIKET